MKICKILPVLAAIWLFSVVPAFAMEFSVNDRPFFSATNNAAGGSGDDYSATLSSTGDKLVFRRYFGDSDSAYVKLESKDGTKDFMSFKVPVGRTLKICKVEGKYPMRSFWFVSLMHHTTAYVSGQLREFDRMEYFWLVGPYKDTYVSFVTRDTLAKYHIDIPKDGTILAHPSGTKDVLNLEIVRLFGDHSATFSWTSLQWDPAKDWFSITKTKF